MTDKSLLLESPAQILGMEEEQEEVGRQENAVWYSLHYHYQIDG